MNTAGIEANMDAHLTRANDFSEPDESTSPFILGGRPAKAADSEILTVLSPADNLTLAGRTYKITAGRIPEILAAAEVGFQSHRKTTPTERGTILTRLAELLSSHQEPLARQIALEAGKPIKLSRVEVQRAVAICRSYAEELSRQREAVYFIEGREASVRYFPLGPVLAITPFNFPLNLVIHKLAPAIAAGTSITIKPASQTPMTALYLGRLAVEAGYEAISVIPCGANVAEALVQSDVFKKVSFTGSAPVGWRLKTLAGKKPITLELGGNGACIINDYPEEKLSWIAQRCAQGAFWFSGQICISLQRIFVHQDRHDAFLKALIDATRSIHVGDPLDEKTDVGPMIHLDEVFRTRGLIKDAIDGGANVVYGGNTLNPYTMNPTILNRTQPSMRVNADECFAPLVTVTPYSQFEEALAAANDSVFGLQAGIFTQDRNKAVLAYEALDVGGVIINDVPTFRLDYMPYGGIKESGLGREGVLCGVAEMSYFKTCISQYF